MGGFPDLTAVFVVITEIVDTVLGGVILARFRIAIALAREPLFRLGTHGAGTNCRDRGGYVGLVMVLLGLLNVLAAPLVALLLGCTMKHTTRLSLSFNRIAAAGRDALASAVAGALAWLLASGLFGHTHPVFAIVTAIVCLAPGLPNHGRQAVGIMLGVAIGILMGELALLVPDSLMGAGALALLRMSGAVLCSILIASAFGLPAVVPIQAGVSAVLVLAMGPENAGWHRMQDVFVGAGVGLLFSQILLTPDPLRQVDGAMHNLLLRIGTALKTAASAVQNADPTKADTALGLIMQAQEDLVLLRDGADAARYAARWSLRGRLAAGPVTAAADQSEHDAIRICAAALLLGDALHEALRQGSRQPPGLASHLQMLGARASGKAGNDILPYRKGSPTIGLTDPAWLPLISPLDILNKMLPTTCVKSPP
nr:FUSC family protein [Ketogulonicigenium vulgare]